MAKYKLLSDELSRMAKVFVQFKEAQELVESLASMEQGVDELAKHKQELLKEVEALTKEAGFAKDNIQSMQKEAAEEAAKALTALEERKTMVLMQVNDMIQEAKQKAASLEEKAKLKVKALEEKEQLIQSQIVEASTMLAEKEDQLAQIESVLAKFKG